jgi:hypothetical protein
MTYICAVHLLSFPCAIWPLVFHLPWFHQHDNLWKVPVIFIKFLSTKILSSGTRHLCFPPDDLRTPANAVSHHVLQPICYQMLVTMCGLEIQEETLTPGDTPPSVRPAARSGTLGNSEGIQLLMIWRTSHSFVFFWVSKAKHTLRIKWLKTADSFLKHTNEISCFQMFVQITVCWEG